MRRAILGTVAVGLLMVGSVVQAATCGTTTGLDTSDVTFRGNNADDCAGLISGNDDGTNLGFTGTWSMLARDNIGGTDTSNTVFGVLWALTATPGSAGTWTLSWSGSGLPLEMDLAVVLKGGNGFATYLFLDEQFLVTPSSGTGTFTIKFENNGGNFPNLSHLSVYGRDATTCCREDVPEPGTLALLGLGLLGLGVTRRKLAL